MRTIRMVVTDIEPGPKNIEGGRTITVIGETLDDGIVHFAMTFASAEDVGKLQKAIDVP